MKVILQDKSGNEIGRAEIDPKRVESAGVINWIDSFFTFKRLSGNEVIFGEVDILPLDDEEVQKI